MFGSKEYSVSIKGRSGVLYTEGKRKVLFSAELLAGPVDYVIYFKGEYFWEKPFENEVISDEDRIRIKQNMIAEFERKGLVVDWD